MPVASLKRDNDLWLRDLSGSGSPDDPRARAAQADLREFLHRGLKRSLASRGGDVEGVEDFVQDALVAVLDRLDEFRGESQFTTWAMSIAIRIAFTEMRRARWKDRSLDQMIGDEGESLSRLFSASPGMEEGLQRQQVTAVMEGVIREQLSSRQRTVLLGELAGIPKSVLAERLETNTNALYKLSHDARRRLREGMLGTGLSETEIRASFQG